MARFPVSSAKLSPSAPPFFPPVNDLTGYRLPVLAQTPDSRIQGVSGIHKLVTTQ